MNQPIQQLPPSIEEDEAIDFAKYFNFLFDNLWFIAGIALVVTLLGLAYALIATPIYEANILIKVEAAGERATKSVLGDLSSSANASPDIKTAVASEMEILRSRSVISRAADKGRFYIDVQPKYFPGFGRWIARRNRQLSNPGLWGIGGYVWGAEEANVSVFNVPEELEGHPFVLTVEDDGRFHLSQEMFAIDIRGRVGDMIRVRTSSGDIELLVDRIAGKPGAQFILMCSARLEAVENLQRALNISERGKQSGIIDVRLDGTDPKRTSRILNEVGQEYIRQNVDRKSEEAEKTISFLNTQLPQLKQELERAESKYNELRNRRGTVDLGEEAKALLQQSVLTQTRMVELKQKKEELLSRYADAHPAVLAINQQIRELKNELAAMDAKTKKLPEVEQNVLTLNRDVKINTELYTTLLSAMQQLRLATESKVGTARLLDVAVAPAKPIRPKRLMVILLSAMMGIGLGVLAAFARKTVLRRIDTPYDIEQLLGLPVAATIAHSESRTQLQIPNDRKKELVLPLDVPSDSTIESLRRFRTSLQFAMLSSKNNVIMITGPTSGVGKSFVSANFATVLASIGKTVMLIDGDLRSGHLHRYFGAGNTNGLSDIITGKIMFGQAIRKNVAENVDFISRGSLPNKPAELLAHENFGKLLELLSGRYDFILIDTAPVLAVSDALVVASHAGAIFNIVRGGITTAGEVEEAVKRLNQAGHKVTGIVFNDSKSRSERYRYRYEHYQNREAAAK